MLQAVTYFRVEQCGKAPIDPKDPNKITNPRKGIFYFSTAENISINKSVDDLIQTATITIPRRFRILPIGFFPNDDRGSELIQNSNNPFNSKADSLSVNNEEIPQGNIIYTRYGFNENITFINPENNDINALSIIDNWAPLFQRGDMITIWTGYYIDSTDPADTNGKKLKLYQQYYGYISSINAGEKIVIELEDFMWYFKQLRIPNGLYNSSPKFGQTLYTYKGLTNYVISLINNKYQIKSINEVVNKTGDSFDKNYLNGLILYFLNESQNDDLLKDKGVFPLSWIKGEQKIKGKNVVPAKTIYKPVISITNNALRTSGLLDLNNNPSFFNLLETIKDKFHSNIYFLQQSLSENWKLSTENNKDLTFGIVGIPYCTNGDNNYTSPWVGNYLNLGYDPYVPINIYNPQVYNFYLNGPNCNVISYNLNWKRRDDFQLSALIKSTHIDNYAKEDGSGVATTVSGVSKKKAKAHAVIVGDIGGSVVTYFYSGSVKRDSNGELEGTLANGGTLKKGTFLEEMASYGNNQLNKVHYEGYYGSIRTFGYPFVNIGDVVNIQDPNYPERNGYYKVKRVNYSMSMDVGLEQEIYLHYRVATNNGQLLRDSSGNVISDGFKYPVYYLNKKYILP